MMKKTRFALYVSAVAAMALGGCASFGGGKAQPDEFKVLTKAPLVVPPEYNLLPPRPGELGPQDLRASEAARQALTGQTSREGVTSIGEQALIAKSNRGLIDPSIRAKLDIETGQLTTKSKSFADRILFWRGGDTFIGDETALEADVEAERLRREALIAGAKGEGPIKIERGRQVRLPGL